MRPTAMEACLFYILLPVLGACQGASQALSDQDVAEIRRNEQEYPKAALANDVEAILAQRTTDFVLMPQGAPLVSGREALRSAYVSGPDRLIAFRLTPAHTEGRDGLANNRGSASLSWVTASDTVTSTGKYVQIWRRQQDGSWQMALEIWNNDEPPK